MIIWFQAELWSIGVLRTNIVLLRIFIANTGNSLFLFKQKPVLNRKKHRSPSVPYIMPNKVVFQCCQW